MTWKFERIFDTDGTELSNATVSTTLAGAADFCDDGRYIWVSAGTNGVYVYEYWGAASDNEPAFNELDELIYPRYDSGLTKKLRLVTVIKLSTTNVSRVTCLSSLAESGSTNYTQASGETAYAKVTARSVAGSAMNAVYMQYANGHVYVSNGATFSQIFKFNCATHAFVSEIDVHEVHNGRTTEYFTKDASYGMTSNLATDGVKLFFVGTSFSDDAPQRFYMYNTVTDVKTTTDIPVRPTRSRTWLTNGFNDSIYISNYNNVSISRFSAETGAFGATIRVNAFPTRIFGGPDRRIWVSSYAGMASLVDYDDDGVHNDWGSEFDMLAAAVDPTDASKIWFVRNDGIVVRLDLNTKEQFQTATTSDWGMSHTKLNGTVDAMMFGHAQTFTDGDGVDHDLLPYMFLIQDGKLLAFRMEKYLYRDVYATVNGQAASVAGPLEYFGETG